MPNVNDFFPSNYIKASDLKGAQPVVTIDRVEYEAVGRQKEMKGIVYFRGKTKGMVLNRTNCNKIVEIAQSPITEEWPGVQVQLFATMVEFQGDTVEAIRVKAPARAKTVTKPKPAPVVEDDEFGTSPDDDGVPTPF